MQTVAAARPAKRNPRRGGGRGYFRNPSARDAVAIVKQLGFGGLGAFAVSTVTQIVPITIESKVGIFISQLLYALGIGWGASKVMGKENGATVRIGAFAFVAGNAVQMWMPDLQQRILEYSPVRAAPGARPVVAAVPGAAVVTPTPLDATLSDVEEVFSYSGLGDVYEVNRGEFGYAG